MQRHDIASTFMTLYKRHVPAGIVLHTKVIRTNIFSFRHVNIHFRRYKRLLEIKITALLTL